MDPPGANRHFLKKIHQKIQCKFTVKKYIKFTARVQRPLRLKKCNCPTCVTKIQVSNLGNIRYTNGKKFHPEDRSQILTKLTAILKFLRHPQKLVQNNNWFRMVCHVLPQLEKFAKNIGFLGRIITKNWKNTPKISKNRWFSFRVWAAGWPPLLKNILRKTKNSCTFVFTRKNISTVPFSLIQIKIGLYHEYFYDHNCLHKGQDTHDL